MNRENLLDFYRGINYMGTSSSFRGIPPRPSEWNVPLIVSKVYRENPDLFKECKKEKSIDIPLGEEDLNYFKSLMLHESLFNFYKSYYNYLCALKLYDGGLLHWINVTSYYAKLYLANSIITLTGNSRYVVNGSNKTFIEDLYKLVNPNGYNTITRRNDGKFIAKHAKYGIEISINPTSNEGVLKIIKDLGSGGSHSDIWGKYSEINMDALDITELTYDDPKNLSDARNIENYTFNGYKQLDFNLSPENFESYFEREYIKDQSNLIYTSETAIVLGVIGELYNLYESLEVTHLPIEKEKLIFMCKHSLGETEQSTKLVDLINSGFPRNNKYIEEYHWYENN